MRSRKYTAAQAFTTYLVQQKIAIDNKLVPLCAGGFAIFGHGNVAGLGEALYSTKDQLPLWRAHNEQSMAHSAIAYAKSLNRKRFMFCTTSIGPGATNMVTAAAVAHVNRLPILLVPGDVFATRNPDPVLQQIENAQDGTLSANDCFRPVSCYFDRITRPEQLLNALPRAIDTLSDPARCGPVTISFPQDVQTHAYAYPEYFFEEKVHVLERQAVDKTKFAQLIDLIHASDRPFLVIGGGVLYAEATEQLQALVDATGIPIGETQAGKGALPWNHPSNMGAIGVTGSTAANQLATQADLVLAIGTRLQDFTSGSRSLFRSAHIVHVNVSRFDAHKHYAVGITGDAQRFLDDLLPALKSTSWQVSPQWRTAMQQQQQHWNAIVDSITRVAENQQEKLTDAQVLGIVNRSGKDDDIVVCAAGSLPAELHKHWRTIKPNSYHVEYGFSCMGYEIAGGIGVRMAHPDQEVIVMLGDGSYLMLNSELHASVMQGIKIIVIVLDNHGFGCINRLQQATGGAPFNNLWRDSQHLVQEYDIDFCAHARSLGCDAQRVDSEQGLIQAMTNARASKKSYVIEIKTDPEPSTSEGGCWWEVAIPEVSSRKNMPTLWQSYQNAKKEKQKI